MQNAYNYEAAKQEMHGCPTFWLIVTPPKWLGVGKKTKN